MLDWILGLELCCETGGGPCVNMRQPPMTISEV